MDIDDLKNRIQYDIIYVPYEFKKALNKYSSTKQSIAFPNSIYFENSNRKIFEFLIENSISCYISGQKEFYICFTGINEYDIKHVILTDHNSLIYNDFTMKHIELFNLLELV